MSYEKLQLRRASGRLRLFLIRSIAGKFVVDNLGKSWMVFFVSFSLDIRSCMKDFSMDRHPGSEDLSPPCWKFHPISNRPIFPPLWHFSPHAILHISLSRARMSRFLLVLALSFFRVCFFFSFFVFGFMTISIDESPMVKKGESIAILRQQKRLNDWLLPFASCRIVVPFCYSSVLFPPSPLAGSIDGSVFRRLILIFFNMVAWSEQRNKEDISRVTKYELSCVFVFTKCTR